MGDIVVLTGSERKKGNTDLLVKAFAEGARKKHQVEIISVADHQIHPCIGCNSCFTREGHACFQKDDMSLINGHMEQFGSYSEEDEVMGNLLADELGDGYFAIGTDFYKSCCNLPKGSGGKRTSHTFYSYDPLAKASKECGFDMSYLDFSIIPESSELKKQTTEYTWMGSVGEGYSFLYNLLPVTYRVWRSPAETFDSMIYVTEAHPTRIKEAK